MTVGRSHSDEMINTVINCWDWESFSEREKEIFIKGYMNGLAVAGGFIMSIAGEDESKSLLDLAYPKNAVDFSHLIALIDLWYFDTNQKIEKL